MLERNKRIKEHPERFQLCSEQFDVVICLEERVYDQVSCQLCSSWHGTKNIETILFAANKMNLYFQVIEDFMTREQVFGGSVHVINLDIQDNHEEATIGAFLVCELAALVGGSINDRLVIQF